jgi:hypothetical protein
MQSVQDNAKDWLCFPMQAVYIYKSTKSPSMREALASWTPGLLSSKYLNPILVRELPLPTPQLPDLELYMTEYAAICIVFTLQGLYTYTHSPHRPPIRRPTDSGAPVNKTNSYGTILLPVWGASSHERSPGAVKQSIMKSPWILRSGVMVSCPLTMTLIHYPPTVMMLRIASSGLVHPHNR